MEASIVDVALRFRDAEPLVNRRPSDDGGSEDGPPDPACVGAEIALASAVVEPRCAISSARAKAMRATLEADGGMLPLAQRATISPEGIVTLRLVNTGKASLALPLSYHSKLAAFTVLAEDEKHAIYELGAPRFEVSFARMGASRGDDAGAAEKERARFARIVLPAGGAGIATITVVPTVARRVAPACPDGGPCGPDRLPPGRYTLYVGELLTDVEAGPPARVTWELR